MRIGVLCAVLIVPLAVGAGAASANVIVQHPVSELINEPTYVETAANGDLFVVGSDSSNVLRGQPSGRITVIANSADGLFLRSRLALGVSGDVFIADQTVVFRADSGGIVSVVDFGTTLPTVLDVAVDSVGNLYVALFGDVATPGTVLKRTPGGSTSVIIDENGAGAGIPLTTPLRLAVDADDNVYVTGFHSNNAFRIAPGGAVTEIIDGSGDGSGNTLLSPRGINVGVNGNV